MKKRQTAVDWLFENLDLSGGGEAFETLRQAMLMEKQQIVDAYVYGSAYGIDFNKGLSPINYYEQTYQPDESND